MKLYFVIDGDPTEEDIINLETIKQAAIEKGFTVNPEFIGGRPKRH